MKNFSEMTDIELNKAQEAMWREKMARACEKQNEEGFKEYADAWNGLISTFDEYDALVPKQPDTYRLVALTD